MKSLISCLWIACLPLFINAQSCLPDGIALTSQAEIDAFPQNYPGCTEIGGNLIVDELEFPPFYRRFQNRPLYHHPKNPV